MNDDVTEIEGVVDRFFAAFTSGPGLVDRLERLRGLFVPEAVVVRTCGQPLTVYDVNGFIAPRLTLLTGGTLTDFREWELAGRTDVFGDVASHWCSYAKTWVQDGVQHSGGGMKTLQLVRTPAGWRISAAAWDDTREGLDLDQAVSHAAVK
ncbi:DUF4440 domain-containing protein [Jatrophihabitans sp. YIM 134969]